MFLLRVFEAALKVTMYKNFARLLMCATIYARKNLCV